MKPNKKVQQLFVLQGRRKYLLLRVLIMQKDHDENKVDTQLLQFPPELRKKITDFLRSSGKYFVSLSLDAIFNPSLDSSFISILRGFCRFLEDYELHNKENSLVYGFGRPAERFTTARRENFHSTEAYCAYLYSNPLDIRLQEEILKGRS